ncbi:MAG: hypothetical protein HYS05_19625 [Acidobacteria bacterium]|nr:hypothetical protein [Acidobacteriota bacterium]
MTKVSMVRPTIESMDRRSRRHVTLRDEGDPGLDPSVGTSRPPAPGSLALKVIAA